MKKRMSSLVYMLDSCNPDSLFAVETDEEDHFLYFFFISLVGFIQGWPHYCLVIVVNGTFMKMKVIVECLCNGC